MKFILAKKEYERKLKKTRKRAKTMLEISKALSEESARKLKEENQLLITIKEDLILVKEELRQNDDKLCLNITLARAEIEEYKNK